MSPKAKKPTVPPAPLKPQGAVGRRQGACVVAGEGEQVASARQDGQEILRGTRFLGWRGACLLGRRQHERRPPKVGQGHHTGALALRGLQHRLVTSVVQHRHEPTSARRARK